MGSVRTGEIALVNAGHLRPLVLGAGGEAEYLDTAPGLPLGFTDGRYTVSRHRVPPDATFLAFTDGLVERRGEPIDLGLQRLASAVAGQAGTPLERLLDQLIRELVGEGAGDDIAVLAFRWTGA